MTKIIVYESEPGTKITEFKRDPIGKKEKVIKWEQHKGDRKKLKEEAEKP